MKKLLIILSIISMTLLSACKEVPNAKYNVTEIEKKNTNKPKTSNKSNKSENKLTIGQEKAKILSSTNWQGTKVYDKEGNDLTKENSNFVGLAKYDDKTSRYEFFDKTTNKTRGDIGVFFITNDGKIRGLISETIKYQAIVDITELNKDKFTYKRTGKDANGKDIEVFVEHIPYTETKLTFTTPNKTLETPTGKISKNSDGDKILSSTLWKGTVVLDEKGNDISSYNGNFLGLAKYDYETNRYEFFNAETGKSRGDYGYYDVVHENKIRANISQGLKYGAIVEITELNKDKFTYKRIGKDKYGKEIPIIVEHIPYEGQFKLEFSK